MRYLIAAIAVALGALISARAPEAAEIHVSHFGQVMPSVTWAVALEQDLFRKNGIDVTDVISSQGGGTTLRNMLAGGVPFADAAVGATVAGIRAGLPVKVVGIAINNAADNAWVVLANSPIKSLRDVIGRKFGTTNPGGVTRVFGEMLLKKHGIETSQVTQVALGVGAGIAAIDSGAVDATYVLEPLLSRYAEKYRVIARVSEVLPKVTPNVLIASQDLIDKEPEKLRALLKAHKQAVEFIYSNPKEAARLAMKRMVNIDEPSLTRAVERMTEARYYSDGSFEADALEGTRQLLEATGDIKGAFDFETIIDRRFRPQ
ncbi:MAG: ABC transporter substrate-binding protein [Xanthobacteraceae bacterium]